MLPIEEELILDKYAQSLIDKEFMILKFNNLSINERSYYLKEIVSYIIQSKPQDSDIPQAIKESELKPTYTPCVMLKKGVAPHILRNIITLPENENKKVLILLLSLFKIAYLRRFNNEKNDPNKWWYWDLSDEKNVEIILQKSKFTLT